MVRIIGFNRDGYNKDIQEEEYRRRQREDRKRQMMEEEERERRRNRRDRYEEDDYDDDDDDDEEYERRLMLCDTCSFMRGGMCGRCGCYVALRAAKRQQYCPDVHKKW